MGNDLGIGHGFAGAACLEFKLIVEYLGFARRSLGDDVCNISRANAFKRDSCVWT